jgi:hypothetical protein
MAEWDFSIRPAAFPFAKIGKKRPTNRPPGNPVLHMGSVQSKQINFCRVGEPRISNNAIVYWLWKYSFF